MKKPLSNSAQKVQDYLSGQGYDLKVIERDDSTRTAAEAAESVGCKVGQIAKSLIFRNKRDSSPILIVASGANRVDTKKVSAVLGFKLGRADGNYVKEHVGFAIGGIPPVGHLNKLQTILDPDLKKYDSIWAAAGTPHALFEITPDALQDITDGIWVELAE
ncbi:MAG: YbaK/EbsC family protein [Desulfobulbaceae bacterium]|nr:MAG: YbaK/EbsC family protein [Desulfobulbaceae bacterium]